MQDLMIGTSDQEPIKVVMQTPDMILLKGKPKTFEIKSIEQDPKGVCWVQFNTGKTFPYSLRDIKKLSLSKEIPTSDCCISNKAGQKFYPQHIWQYQFFDHSYYRIQFNDKCSKEYDEDYLEIQKSVLVNKESMNIFNYLKDVSGKQVIQTESGPISLHDKYEKVRFINEDSALGTYLNPSLLHTYPGYTDLIYPFYSNLSQMKAVDNAFKSQISIIQGPPGTGKTQTILNIIANIISRKKSVLIVSNNNSAVENIQEKLEKEGLGFTVAKLGKSDNKKDFIANGQSAYPDMSDWHTNNNKELTEEINNVSRELETLFKRQNDLVQNRQELAALKIESKHFFEENHYDTNHLEQYKHPSSKKLIQFWIKLDLFLEESNLYPTSLWKRLKKKVQLFLFSFMSKRILGVTCNSSNLQNYLMDIKALFYTVRSQELYKEIDDAISFLKSKHASDLLQKQSELSMKALKAVLDIKYKGGEKDRTRFEDKDLSQNGTAVTNEYPVILSTTFSAISSLRNYTFDYLVMDEASQVSIESAALAMQCAKNAVIVGDTKQLTNIISDEVRKEITQLNDTYLISEKYDCLGNNFLSSIAKVFPNAPRTLLREHYRCAPMIINYCNQKFYNNELLIMTKYDSSTTPMEVIKTVKGNHSRSVLQGNQTLVFNQREIDEFKDLMNGHSDIPLNEIGVITPYRGQVALFRKEIPMKDIEVDTIHKYQGREKDIIVMSTVADKYNPFVDNANLINVAVSRARKKFVLITNSNENPEKGNIRDLIDYINYNHGEIIESDLHSIFDLLYSCYSEQRLSYLNKKRKISEYDSENIAYYVISAILKRNNAMSNLKVMPFYHLNSLIRNTSLLTEEEAQFVRNSWSHLDFLIENEVSKIPVLAIEVDGFAYHHSGTKQSDRDKIKDSVLSKYDIPLLRLSTAGSGEINKIEMEIKKRIS
jgi:superfamily I DNA and/or RNA helicase